MSTIDSELRSEQQETSWINWPLMVWSACGAGVLMVIPIFLPSHWLVATGASALFISCVAVLDRMGIVKLGQDVRETTHRRIETYYKEGRSLYCRLANDSAIAPEDVRQFVADVWVNPTTQYLKGAMGDGKAEYFLSIRGEEPKEEAVELVGYERALARQRIMIRLERLRRIAGEV